MVIPFLTEMAQFRALEAEPILPFFAENKDIKFLKNAI